MINTSSMVWLQHKITHARGVQGQTLVHKYLVLGLFWMQEQSQAWYATITKRLFRVVEFSAATLPNGLVEDYQVVVQAQ